MNDDSIVGQRVSPVSIVMNFIRLLPGVLESDGIATGVLHPTSETGGTRCPTVLLALALAFLCVGLHAQEPAAKENIRFRAVDIYVDSKDKPLAAYQVELTVTNGNAKIVGIEGGEHPAFGQPPFYDPKAMQRERVILAAFSTDAADKLPSGKTRVATIHLQVSGTAEPGFKLKMEIAAESDGKRIAAQVHVEERKSP